jgi:transcriptional regulator with PAS, ATPase and Fis domain
LSHLWPGNVRELDHAVERGVLMGREGWVQAQDLGLQQAAASAPRLEDLSLEEVEKMFIQKALARYPNVSQAAQALGLSRSALYRRLEKYGL